MNDPSLTSELTASIKPTLDYLMTLKFPSGNYPSSIGSSGGDLLVHWCHGAPGWIHLFALAYKVCSVCLNILRSFIFDNAEAVQHCLMGTWQGWMNQQMRGEFFQQFLRVTVIGKGLQDVLTPPGWPQWRTTHHIVEYATKLALDRPLWRLLAASGAMHWNGASWTMTMIMRL